MHFQILAIIILLTFYGFYFGKMLLQKKKGIQTDHLGKVKKGIQKRIEISMKIVSIIVPILEAISIILNLSSLPLEIRYIGIIIAIIGTVIFAISIFTMRDSWRAGVSREEKTKLITSGIYQFSRNPAFLGFDLVYIGISLTFFNPILLLISLLCVLLFHLQIVLVEEKFLIQVFGNEYLNYQNKVNRYLGRKLQRKK